MFELPIATAMSECLNRKLKGLTNFRSPDAMSEFKPRYHTMQGLKAGSVWIWRNGGSCEGEN